MEQNFPCSFQIKESIRNWDADVGGHRLHPYTLGRFSGSYTIKCINWVLFRAFYLCFQFTSMLRGFSDSDNFLICVIRIRNVGFCSIVSVLTDCFLSMPSMWWIDASMIISVWIATHPETKPDSLLISRDRNTAKLLRSPSIFSFLFIRKKRGLSRADYISIDQCVNFCNWISCLLVSNTRLSFLNISEYIKRLQAIQTRLFNSEVVHVN